MLYNILHKMQNLPTYKGLLGSSVSLSSFVISKATHVEVLQMATLWLGVATGCLTAVSLFLTVDKKLRDRRREKEEAERKKRRRNRSRLCGLLFPILLLSLTSCSTIPRAPVPDTRPLREQAVRVVETNKQATTKAKSAKARVAAIRAVAPTSAKDDLEQLDLDLSALLEQLSYGAEAGYLLTGSIETLGIDIQKLGGERDSLRKENTKLKPALDRWRKAALLSAAFSGLLLIWIFRTPLLRIARAFLGIP